MRSVQYSHVFVKVHEDPNSPPVRHDHGTHDHGREEVIADADRAFFQAGWTFGRRTFTILFICLGPLWTV